MELNQKLNLFGFFFNFFFYTNGSVGAKRPLSILNPVTDKEILAPKLVADQNKMVV